MYREFLRTRKVFRDENAWRTFCRPVLGVLAIAKVPLTAEQLAQFTRLSRQEVRDTLRDIQQFLYFTSEKQKHYYLYHKSFTDFFSNEDLAEEFWIDLEPLHESIVNYYRGQAATWQNVRWQAIDDYGLLYLASHIFALRNIEAYRQQLYDLLCQPFMQENYRRYGFHQSFTKIVDLAIEAAGEEEPPDFVQGVRASLLYATLGQLFINVPLEALFVLAQTDQVARSLGFVAMMQEQDKQYAGYLTIASALLDQGKLAEARALLKQTWDAAPEAMSKFASPMAPVFAQAGLIEQASKLMERTEDASDKFFYFNAIIQSHARAGEVAQVLDMTERIQGDYYKTLMLSDAAQALAHGNYINQALTVARTIQDAYRRALALCGIALTLTGPTQSEQARAIAEEALASAQSITVAINGCFGEGDKVIAVCEVVRTWARLAVLKPEDNVIVQALSDAEALAQRTKYSVEEKNSLRVWPPQIRPRKEVASAQNADFVTEVGLDPDLDEVLNAQLARALAEKKAAQNNLITTFRKMNEQEREKNEIQRVAQLLSRALQVLQAALVKIGRWEEADKQLRDDAFAQSMPPGTPASQQLMMNTDTGSKENTAQAVADRMKAIQDELNSSLERARAIDREKRTAMEEANRAYLLEKVAKAWSLAGHNDKALNVVEVIGRNENKVSALAKLVQSHLLAGENELARARAAQAFELATSMHSATTLCEAARSLFQVGDTQGADAAVSAALEIVNALIEWKQRTQTLCRMVHILAWDGPVEIVLAEADKLIWEFKASAIGEMAMSLLQAGKTERAKKLANEALLAGQNSSIGQTLGKNRFWGLQRSGLLKEAEMMRLEDETEDIESKWHFSSNVLLQRFWEGIRSSLLFSLTREWENQVKMASTIAQALCLAGQVDQCQQVTEAMRNPYWKALTLSKMAQIIAQSPHRDVALGMVTRAATIAETVPEDRLHNSRPILLQCEIAQAWAKLGDVAHTRDAAAKARLLVRKGIGIQYMQIMSSQVLHSVAQALILAGEKADLLVLLAEGTQFAAKHDILFDTDVNFQLDVLREVVNALMAAGYSEEAQQLMLELNDQTIAVPAMSLEKRTEKQKFSLRALQTEFANTRFQSKDALFALLERSAFDLSAFDQGQLLWKIYTVVQQINSWFDLPVKAVSQPSQ